MVIVGTVSFYEYYYLYIVNHFLKRRGTRIATLLASEDAFFLAPVF